ncbi:MAG: glycosyltransferase [Proteobacteria bacterium]|nr:glycosyltransferase [Pseudomonadota bacterium]
MKPVCLHLPVTALPWTVGGKEVFCFGLADELKALGWDARIAVHQQAPDAPALGEHDYRDIPVTVLPPVEATHARRSRYGRRPTAIPGFRDLLARLRPSVVHLHDLSSEAGILHLEMARAAGARTVMSYHSPGQSCPQRELLYRRRVVCDGELRVGRCTECRLAAAGLPAGLARLAACFPAGLLNPEGASRLERVLTAREMTEAHIAGWREAIALCDAVQVYADWARRLLVANGVPESKIAVVRSGQPRANCADNRPAGPARSGDALRIVYVGRCTHEKGIDTLVEAVLSLPPAVPVSVAFLGPGWDNDQGTALRRRINGDPRFEAPRFTAPEKVVTTMRAFDVCVVPSRWLETGPIVVYEAFAAGLPVVGSRLGGIADLVTEGVDGLLFEPGDATALSRIIAGLAGDRSRLDGLVAGIRPPRTFADVAREMDRVYRKLM